MTKKFIIALISLVGLIILSFVLYFLLDGSPEKFLNTAKNHSLIQAFKDMYMSIYKSISTLF